MRSQPEFSPQTLSVLVALGQEASDWQHGYALARQTGLKSGTLYPILIRLADRGLVEACWQEEPVPGRPRRHLYRLTPDGLASATAATAAAEQAGAERAGAERAGAERAGAERAGAERAATGMRPGAGPRRGRGVVAPAVP